MSQITVYRAKKIITMNPNCPVANHVAVRDGRILGVGALEDLATWGNYALDERFADKILMPGFVEGHAHAMEGTQWRHTYCGFFDRRDPDGTMWDGAKSIEAVMTRLADAEARLSDPDAPLPGWQFDPIYFDNRKISRQELDRISSTRPIGVLHASGHIMNVNTKGLELAGLLKTGINHPGVPLGDDGLPTGELRGPEVYTPVSIHVGFDKDALACDEAGLIDFGKLCVRSGVTTVTDLAAALSDETVKMMSRVTARERFPARIVSLRFFMGLTAQELIDHALQLKQQSSDQLRLGMIKVIVDGSIQGFTARIRWPGYHNGAENGLWYITPEHLSEIYHLALKNGLHVHSHTNGDEATDLALDMMERALRSHPHPDHRFTIQHGQLINAAQFKRMNKLGLCVNLFANHHFYWGNEHYRLTVGPERAERMNACATALASGVPMTIHSDAPVTPLGPLFTAWCAVNRITASGRVLGKSERISVEQALHAVTLGAAYTLKLDDEVGSIEVGKRADFAVLEDDPTTVDPVNLKDIGVWGTVQSGRVFAASEL